MSKNININNNLCSFCCQRKSDSYDYLTKRYFCYSCSDQLMQTARHANYEHLRLRLWQRYKIRLDLNIYFDMLSQINDSRTNTIIVKLRNTASVHKVSCCEKSVFIVYHKKSKALLTAFPRKMAIPTMGNTRISGFLK